jgi:uncharacterized protein (TIGR02996 family)
MTESELRAALTPVLAPVVAAAREQGAQGMIDLLRVVTPLFQRAGLGQPTAATFADPPPPPARVRHPDPEAGSLTAEQALLAQRAHESGDRAAWGALGDHLAENGFANAGAVLARHAEDHPASRGGIPITPEANAQTRVVPLDPGHFRYALVRDGADLRHSLRLVTPDGHAYQFFHTAPRNWKELGRLFADGAQPTGSPPTAPRRSRKPAGPAWPAQAHHPDGYYTGDAKIHTRNDSTPGVVHVVSPRWSQHYGWGWDLSGQEPHDPAAHGPLESLPSYMQTVGRLLSPAQMHTLGLGGKPKAADEVDWRPSETMPEDFYAMSEGPATGRGLTPEGREVLMSSTTNVAHLLNHAREQLKKNLHPIDRLPLPRGHEELQPEWTTAIPVHPSVIDMVESAANSIGEVYKRNGTPVPRNLGSMYVAPFITSQVNEHFPHLGGTYHEPQETQRLVAQHMIATGRLHAPESPAADWRPDEVMPEDFYAMSERFAAPLPEELSHTLEGLDRLGDAPAEAVAHALRANLGEGRGVDALLARARSGATTFAEPPADPGAALGRLAAPEAGLTRRGGDGPGVDHGLRQSAADALAGAGRHYEAGLLRDPARHVVVHPTGVGPKVLPARYTLAHVRQLLSTTTPNVRVNWPGTDNHAAPPGTEHVVVTSPGQAPTLAHASEILEAVRRHGAIGVDKPFEEMEPLKIHEYGYDPPQWRRVGPPGTPEMGAELEVAAPSRPTADQEAREAARLAAQQRYDADHDRFINTVPGLGTGPSQTDRYQAYQRMEQSRQAYEAMPARPPRGTPYVMPYYGTREHLSHAARQTLDKLNAGLQPEQFAILKRDSSINKPGFEIVTHPATLETHKARWAPVLGSGNEAGLASNSQKYNTGLHVHVARSALTPLGVYKVLAFVNGAANKEYVEAVARRYLSYSDYAKLDPTKGPRDATRFNDNRREAVNLQNRHTVEFRLFGGTLDPAEFFTSLEFADALTHFSRAATTSATAVAGTDAFFRFVSAQRKRYPNLDAFHRRFAAKKGLPTDFSDVPAASPVDPLPPVRLAVSLAYRHPDDAEEAQAQAEGRAREAGQPPVQEFAQRILPEGPRSAAGAPRAEGPNATAVSTPPPPPDATAPGQPHPTVRPTPRPEYGKHPDYGAAENLLAPLDVNVARESPQRDEYRRRVADAVAGREGLLPSVPELKSLAQAGQSVRGQYRHSWEVLRDFIGHSNAHLFWTANAILSPLAGWEKHSRAAMRLVRQWHEGTHALRAATGDPNARMARPDIEQLVEGLKHQTMLEERYAPEEAATAKQAGKKVGDLKPLYASLSWKEKAKQLVQLFHEPEKYIADFSHLAAARRGKIVDFAGAALRYGLTGPQSLGYAPIDTHMAKAVVPEEQDLRDAIERLYTPTKKQIQEWKQKTPQRWAGTPATYAASKVEELRQKREKAHADLAAAAGDLGGILTASTAAHKLAHSIAASGEAASDLPSVLLDAQKAVIARPHVYKAYKTAVAEAARQLDWSVEEVQESVWSAVISIVAARNHGIEPHEILSKLQHADTFRAWDVGGLLNTPEITHDLERLGLSPRRLENFRLAAARAPSARGPIRVDAPAHHLDVARRIPAVTRGGEAAHTPITNELERRGVPPTGRLTVPGANVPLSAGVEEFADRQPRRTPEEQAHDAHILGLRHRTWAYYKPALKEYAIHLHQTGHPAAHFVTAALDRPDDYDYTLGAGFQYEYSPHEIRLNTHPTVKQLIPMVYKHTTTGEKRGLMELWLSSHGNYGSGTGRGKVHAFGKIPIYSKEDLRRIAGPLVAGDRGEDPDYGYRRDIMHGLLSTFKDLPETSPQDYVDRVTPHLAGAMDQDWRSSETTPEDFYAMSDPVPPEVPADVAAGLAKDARAAVDWPATRELRQARRPTLGGEKTAFRFRSVARRRRVLAALKTERELANAIGGHHLPDSEPADVVYLHDPLGNPVTDPGHLRQALAVRAAAVERLKDPAVGPEQKAFLEKVLATPAHAFEVKTLLTTGRQYVQMNPHALAAKKAWSQKHGVPIHAVAVDRRRGGKHSGHAVYVAADRVAPTVPLADMAKAATMAHVLTHVSGGGRPVSAEQFADATNHEALAAGLRMLASTEHADTRQGGPNPEADHVFRGRLADLLQDHGREPEAQLLRDRRRHVMVHPTSGAVVPARYTDRHYRRRLFELQRTIRDSFPDVHREIDWHEDQTPESNGWVTCHHYIYGNDREGVMEEVHHKDMPRHLADEVHGFLISEVELQAVDKARRTAYHRRLSALREAPYEEPLPDLAPGAKSATMAEGDKPTAHANGTTSMSQPAGAPNPETFSDIPAGHAAFQSQIGKQPADATVRKVYADWIEEHDPASLHPEHGQHTLHFLRNHEGAGWVQTGTDGKLHAGRRWSMAEIRAHVAAAGGNWFTPDAMSFFGTRLHGEPIHGPGGVYFVTSEQPPHGPRAFTVRHFEPGAAHEPGFVPQEGYTPRPPRIGTFVMAGHPDAKAARAVAQRMASGQSVDRANANHMAGVFND